MDRFVAPAYLQWPSGVLPLAFPHWTIAEQALETFGVADGGLHIGGSDPLCVLFRSVPGLPWPDPKPARDRGRHQLLQSALVHCVSPSVRRSGLITAYATAAGRRGRTPAAQMVRLQCRDI